MSDRAVTAALRPTPASEQTRKWEDPNPTKSSGSWGVGSTPGAPAGLLSIMFRMTETERIQRPFAQSGIVNACVQVRAELFCAARPRLWESDDEDADELAAEDELSTLFYRPNGIMGRVKFWRTVSQHLSLAGGTFLFLTKPNSDEPIGPGEMPGALWPIREDLVEIKLDKQNRPGLYEFKAGEKLITFPEHAVAHIYDADPDNPYRGIGPMQAAFRTVNNLWLAEGFDDALVRSGGQIGGFISPKDGVSLGPDQQKELIDSLQQKNLDPKKSGKWAITPEGLDFQAAAWSPKDMEASELRILGRNHVMMVFRLTPPLLGIVEDVNRANGNVARRIFYESHGIPFYDFMADEVHAQLLEKIGRPEVALSFDWQSIPAMREDADAVQKRVRGWMECGRSFKEAASLESLDVDGMDTMEGVDERYVDNGLTPVEIAHTLPPKPVLPQMPGDPGTPPKPKEPDPKALTRDAVAERRRRLDALAENEKRLAPADRAMTRGIANVFKRYVREQTAKLREVAASGAGVAASVTPWETPLRSLGPVERAWAERMDLVPEQRWITVRGASPDEIEALLLRIDERWQNELWAAARGPLLRALEDAARAAAQQVEAVVQIDATRPAMVRFMAQKEILLKEGPMSVVAQQVRRALVLALADAPATGTIADRVRAVFEELESDLEALADRLGTRAAMVARTETASAANAARFEQWGAAGIAQHEWLSAGDDIVREAHQIDGEIVVIGERFSNGMRYPGEPGHPAESTINCLPGDQRVAGAVLAASKAWYSGPMVEIETDQGHRLTVTINHPVLTTRGFVRAGALREGDHVLCEPLDLHGRLARWDIQDQQRPPTIEQVFDAIAVHGSRWSFAPGRLDLYGDARFFKGEVDVVSLLPRPARVDDRLHQHGKLMAKGQPVALTEQSEQIDLVLAGASVAVGAAPYGSRVALGHPRGAELSPDRPRVSAQGAPLQGFGLALAARRHADVAEGSIDRPARARMLMSEAQHARAGSEGCRDGFGVERQPTQAIHLGATADLHPVILDPSGDGLALHAELATELLRGFPGRVTPNRIRSLRSRHFEGPVFDLHTAQGYFAAGEQATTLIRNCRCALSPVIREPVGAE